MAGSGLAPFLPARALETPGPGGQQRLGQRAGAVQHTEQFSQVSPGRGTAVRAQRGQRPRDAPACLQDSLLPTDTLAPHLRGGACLLPLSLSLSTAPSAACREEVSLGPVSNGRAG